MMITTMIMRINVNLSHSLELKPKHHFRSSRDKKGTINLELLNGASRPGSPIKPLEEVYDMAVSHPIYDAGDAESYS